MIKYIFNHNFNIEVGNIYFLFTKFDDGLWRAKVQEKIFRLYLQSISFFTHFVFLYHPWVALMELLPSLTDRVYTSFDKLLEYLNNHSARQEYTITIKQNKKNKK